MALLPLTALVVVQNLDERAHISDEARQNALAAAESIAAEEGRLVDDAIRLLTALAATPAVHAVDTTECDEALRRVLAQSESYANLGVVGADGLLRCSALPFTPPVDLSDREWFREAVETRGPAAGSFQVGRVTGIATINVGVPVSSTTGMIEAVVFAALDLERLSLAALRGHDLTPGTVVTVFDPNRTVLVRSGDALFSPGATLPDMAVVDDVVRLGGGTFERAALDGTQRLHGFTTIRGGPTGELTGYALVTIPSATAYAEADASLLVGILTLLALGLLGMVGAYVAADRLITRPLHAVTETASRIATGDLSARTGVTAGRGGELGQLATTVDGMAAALEEREQALRAAEVRYRTLVERLPSVVYIDEPDTDANSVFVSPSVEAVTGYAVQEWTAGSGFWQRCVHPDDLEAAVADLARGLASTEPFTSEYRFRTKSGRFIWVSDDAVVVRDAAGTAQYVLGVFTDVTERRQLEQQLLDARRMEGIGRLAGGVAHDFNNLLTAIIGYADLARDDLGDDQAVATQIREIAGAAERARDLTAQLLAFARRQVLRPRLVDVDAVVVDLVPMLTRLIGEDVRIETRLRAGGARARVDPAQLGQVIVNLVTNARDAMPEGGLVEIVTDVETLAGTRILGPLDGSVRGETASPGTYVVIDVRDTGTGMDPATQEHLFEPFFTTKSPGAGTGLGLSTSYGIVKQSGGYLDVRSRPGQGTTFRVRLPVATEDDPAEGDAVEPPAGAVAAPASDATADAPVSASDRRSILVVEDEPAVRMLAARILRSTGAEVEAVASGEDALALADGARRFDLLVTDVVLPGLSGPQVAERLLAMGRVARVLYTTGYPRDRLGARGLVDPSIELLEKPYLPDALVAHVERLVGRSDGRDPVAGDGADTDGATPNGDGADADGGAA